MALFGFIWLKMGLVADCYEDGGEYTGSIKGGEFCILQSDLSGSCSVGH